METAGEIEEPSQNYRNIYTRSYLDFSHPFYNSFHFKQYSIYFCLVTQSTELNKKFYSKMSEILIVTP